MIHQLETIAETPRYTQYRCRVCCRAFRVLAGTNPTWPEDCEGRIPDPPLPPRPWSGTPRQRDLSRPNVAIITTALAHGGAEEWMRCLIHSTPGINWIGVGQPHHAMTTPESVAAFERLLPVVPVPERWDALDAADVLITWGTVAARETPPHGKPVVFVSHGQDTQWTLEAVKAARPHTTHWVGVSDSALAAFQEAGVEGIAIDNAIDTSRLTPTLPRIKARMALGVPLGKKLLAQIGRNSSEKRPGALASTIAALPEDWHGLAVGWACNELPASPRCTNLSNRLDIVTVLSAADCVLSMSDGEGFGLALAEALWFGLPVVATPVGVLTSLPAGSLWWRVEHDATPQQVAEAVLDTQRTPNAGRAGITRLHAEARWSIARFAANWTDYITRLVAKPEIQPSTAKTLPVWTPDLAKRWAMTCKVCEHERVVPNSGRLTDPRYCVRDLDGCGGCISRAIGKYQSRLSGLELPCDKWDTPNNSNLEQEYRANRLLFAGGSNS